MGDAWVVDGVDEKLERLVWKRFASGLNQPLGLVVIDDRIHVIGRDQLTRLHDTNLDGEADFYECLTNEFPTARGNSFALTLHQDDKGRFYWFTRSSQFGMTRYTPDPNRKRSPPVCVDAMAPECHPMDPLSSPCPRRLGNLPRESSKWAMEATMAFSDPSLSLENMATACPCVSFHGESTIPRATSSLPPTMRGLGPWLEK